MLRKESKEWDSFGFTWVLPMGIRRLLRITKIKKLLEYSADAESAKH
jgi:hypothetical protein